MGARSRFKPARLPSKLVEIRALLELSQGGVVASLAPGPRITRERISAYERGDREPPLDVLLAYGRIAGLYVDVLIDDSLDLPSKLPASPKSKGARYQSKAKPKAQPRLPKGRGNKGRTFRK